MRTNSRRSRCSSIASTAPLSLQPHVVQCFNRFFLHGSFSWRESGSIVVTLGMMVAVYVCSQNMLVEFLRRSHDLTTHITPIIAALVAALSIMIASSAAVATISNLFAAKDLDFWLSSPLSPREHLRGKVGEIFGTTIWMLLIFALPIFLSFGSFFHAGPAYYLLAPMLVGGLLISAVLIGIFMATILAAIIPARRCRHIFAALALSAMTLGFLVMEAGEPRETLIAEQLSLSSLYNNAILNIPWLPPYLIGSSIESLLHNSLGQTVTSLTVVWVMAYASWLLAQSVFELLFITTISRLHSSQSPRRFHTHRGGSVARFIGACAPRTSAALMTKDLYSFCRDITHTLQLIMLLTICILYLYNFSRIEAPTKVGPEVLRVWDVFLILANIVLGAMVLISLAARFVFPSISLEGSSLWLMQTMPISTHDILRAKYRGWFIPCAIISMLIFSSGACALGLQPILVLTTLLAGLIMSHGLVALALGLGASFARFDWEHPAQITTSSGNLLFMVLGMCLLGLNIIPLTAMFGSYVLFPSVFQDSAHSYLLLGSGLATVAALNGVVGWLSLRTGQRALEKHWGFSSR